MSSCWVRTVMPWTGNAWGMIAIPRMGQEVVIQFEEGDPDRPICTGMLYNEATKPPYELPANKTQSGVKTNSSKGGGGFNELMFEDKKDEELVRFQAEKDYEQIVKNNATITVGMEKMDAGDLTQTVYNDQTETIKEGNHTFTIEKGDQTFTISKGSQIIGIKTDKTETIENDKTLNVSGNVAEDIGGNRDESIGGDTSETVGGNVTQDVSGKITVTAGMSIELKVGTSSIKIDPSGVTIKGGMININGTGMVEMKSPLTTVKGSGMLTLKGGITMIN